MNEKLNSAIAHIETLTAENLTLVFTNARLNQRIKELQEEIESLKYELLEENGDE